MGILKWHETLFNKIPRLSFPMRPTVHQGRNNDGMLKTIAVCAQKLLVFGGGMPRLTRTPGKRLVG